MNETSVNGKYDRQPMMIVEYVDNLYGAKAYLVIDMLVDGVAGGGMRMKPDLMPEEVVKLARTMTRKFTLIDPKIGGAKCGIDFDPARPEKLLVMQRFFDFIKPFLFNCYVTGADLNTNESEIVACARAIGLPAPQYALAKKLGQEADRLKRFYAGINLAINHDTNLVLNSAATGYGICAAALRAMRTQRLEGNSVAIQGFGNVGGSVAKFLAQCGACIRAISDRDGTIYCKSGLDIDLLLAKRNPMDKTVFGVLRRDERCPTDYELIPDPEAIYELAEDLFIPVADSQIITEQNYQRITAKHIVCGANDPFAPADIEERLYEAGKVVVPDFVANAGTAALYHALLGGSGPVTSEELLKSIATQIGAATKRALRKSQIDQISPRAAAEAIAAEIINSYPEHHSTTYSSQKR